MPKAKPALKRTRSLTTAKAARPKAARADARKTAVPDRSLATTAAKKRSAQASRAQASTKTSMVQATSTGKTASRKAARTERVTRTSGSNTTTQRRASQSAKTAGVRQPATAQFSAPRKSDGATRKKALRPTLADRAYAALSKAGRPMTGTALAKRLRVSTTAIGPTLSALNRTRRAAKQADGSWLAI
jgi:hypothetical protein